ncbi:hypothetical protein FPV67DRAFT_427991 [Lyophyllum atratum]|nr:hypothetical protein FPV67DRAFT_427991 [Lyophyllum atratum]
MNFSEPAWEPDAIDLQIHVWGKVEENLSTNLAKIHIVAPYPYPRGLSHSEPEKQVELGRFLAVAWFEEMKSLENWLCWSCAKPGRIFQQAPNFNFIIKEPFFHGKAVICCEDYSCRKKFDDMAIKADIAGKFRRARTQRDEYGLKETLSPGIQRKPAGLCATCECSPATRLCSACRCIRYCGPDCQRKDWVLRHKKNCKMVNSLTRSSTIDLAGDLMALSEAGRVIVDRCLEAPLAEGEDDGDHHHLD